MACRLDVMTSDAEAIAPSRAGMGPVISAMWD
jgi:hypothetical protein